MKRRDLLRGVGLAPAATLVPDGTTRTAADSEQAPQGAVFHQHSYYSFDGTGDAYTPPAGNKSTVDYRASLGEEEFLRRHWFS